MQTVRKNSKEYQIAKIKSNGAKMYSLRNNFIATTISGTIEDFDFNMGRLTKNDGSYQLQVHSNLWYTWTV